MIYDTDSEPEDDVAVPRIDWTRVKPDPEVAELEPAVQEPHAATAPYTYDEIVQLVDCLADPCHVWYAQYGTKDKGARSFFLDELDKHEDRLMYEKDAGIIFSDSRQQQTTWSS